MQHCNSNAGDVAKLQSDTRFRILSNVIYSQIKEHTPFGGVVPEIASRRHLEILPAVVEEAIERAGCRPRSVAVTVGPGLVGSLLVGISFAKGFSYARRLPLYGVHHISGHLHAILLERSDWAPPFLALVVSGGHTQLISVPEWGKYEIVGRTIDDAAGEAFDKAAKLLGLGFPGGPCLAALADRAGEERIKLAGTLMRNSDDFSFSGIKTALRNLIARRARTQACRTGKPVFGKPAIDDAMNATIAASFQDAVVETLNEKSARAIERSGTKRFLLTGGVAANRRLREVLGRTAARLGVDFAVPAPELCTDNAAMIAASALAYPRTTLDPGASALASWTLS